MIRKSRSDPAPMGSSDPMDFSRTIMRNNKHDSIKKGGVVMITTLLLVMLALIIVGVVLIFASWPYVLAAALAIAAFRFVRRKLSQKGGNNS